MVGLPGIGLGGVFYVLLIGWIIIREFYLEIRGGPRHPRWRAIATLGCYAGIIIVVIAMQAWALHGLVPARTFRSGSQEQDSQSGWMVMLLIPFLILSALMIGTYVM